MSEQTIKALTALADDLRTTRITTLHEGVEMKIDAEREIRRILRAAGETRTAPTVQLRAI